MIALLHHDSLAEHFLIAGGVLLVAIVVALAAYLQKKRLS